MTDAITNRLLDLGIEAKSAEAVLEIDALFQFWRRRASRRELGLSAIAALELPIDLAQMDILVAIQAPRNEFGEDSAEETMVGTVAERLMIDPSRASRLVSEMVSAGYVVRAASQSDARRTIIGLTKAGRTIVDAVRLYKFMLMSDYLESWSDEERKQFVKLMTQFSKWVDRSDKGAAKHKKEIAALAAEVAANAPKTRSA